MDLNDIKRIERSNADLFVRFSADEIDACRKEKPGNKLQYFVDISAQSDSDYIPLSYQFDLELNNTNTVYLHSYILVESYLHNAILPIDCNFSIWCHVADFQGAEVSEYITLDQDYGCVRQWDPGRDGQNMCLYFVCPETQPENRNVVLLF
jgi:hypothetical protein